MSIEKNLERIATALESLAAGAVDLGVVILAADKVIDGAGKTPVQIAPAPILGDGVEEPQAATPAPKPPKRARKPKSTPAPEAPTGDPVTVENVREGLRIFLKAHEAPEAAAILAEFNSPSVTALDPQHYAAVLGRLSA